VQFRAKIWYPLLLYCPQQRRAVVSRNQLQLARHVTVVVGQVDRESVTSFLKSVENEYGLGAHCTGCSLLSPLCF